MKNDTNSYQTIGRLCSIDDKNFTRTLYIPQNQYDDINFIISENIEFTKSLKLAENNFVSAHELVVKNFGKRGYQSETPGTINFNKRCKKIYHNFESTQSDSVMTFLKDKSRYRIFTAKELYEEMIEHCYFKPRHEKTMENKNDFFFTDTVEHISDVLVRTLKDLEKTQQLVQIKNTGIVQYCVK